MILIRHLDQAIGFSLHMFKPHTVIIDFKKSIREVPGLCGLL